VVPENRPLLHSHCVFYNIDKGQILIDGTTSMRLIGTTARQYEYRSQDVIFGGTIKENIAY
jgi:ABC-type multidrug transport system fused ATPase/permease subunit